MLLYTCQIWAFGAMRVTQRSRKRSNLGRVFWGEDGGSNKFNFYAGNGNPFCSLLTVTATK